MLPCREAEQNGISPDRWQYYLNQVLPGEIRILNRLSDDNPMQRWFVLTQTYSFAELNFKNADIKRLIVNSTPGTKVRFGKARIELLQKYYGQH